MPTETRAQQRPLSWSSSSTAVAIAVATLAVACERGPKTVSIPIPNTPSPAKVDTVELTNYPDKIVVSNWQTNDLWNCAVSVGTARAWIERLPAQHTVEVARVAFRPYVPTETFFAGRANNRLECDAPTGRVEVRFQSQGTFTAPAEALKLPK